MILNSPIIYDLTLGQPQREPTSEDTVMLVPPVIQPVVASTFPHQENLNVSTPFTSSFVIDAAQNRAPAQGQLTTLIATLAPGLWELELILASWFDYNTAAGVGNFNSILITFFGNQRQLLPRIAAIGSFNDYNRVRILTRLDLPVSLRNADTLAAQNNSTRMSMNAIRLL